MTSNRTVTVDAGGRGRGNEAAALTPVPGVIVVYSEATIPGAGVYEARAELSIGRQADRDIFIEDPGLSRQHATVLLDSPRFEVRDGGSHNGTYVNGELTAGPTIVRFGDVIRCGQTLFMLVENAAAFKDWRRPFHDVPLVGGPALRHIVRTIELIAPRQVEVLVVGESGTGKELLVGLLHKRSGRRGPLVAVNCAAISEALFESELFGAKKGAFTGASADRPGLMQAARGGTFLLDEIAEMPLHMQPKLLRAVELRQIRPVGGDCPLAVDLRLVAATHRDLAQEVTRGRFREDLYHRLCGITVEVPPLRQRRYDIALLASHFLQQMSGDGDGVEPLSMSTDFVEALLPQRWPGNARQLRQALHTAMLKAAIAGTRHLDRPHLEANASEDEQVVRLKRALRDFRGNVTQAAAELGLSRSKLYELMKAHNVRAEDFRRR